MKEKAAVARVFSSLFARYRTMVPSSGLRVLMYHAIGSRIPSDIQGRYTLPPKQFAEHMRQLKASSSLVVPLGAPGERTEVAVTFDDGYRDNYSEAFPVLQELGLPFTIFVTSDFIRSGDSLYLRPTELRALADNPLVTIGAHGKSHTPFTRLGFGALRQELRDSRAYLEDVTGRAVNTMSYPHGATNARIRDAVAEAGFSLAASSRFGCNSKGSDLLSLRRTDIWSSDDGVEFNRKLSGAWDWLSYVGSNSRDVNDA
jgi:peptidoglycan/xylan/chitin deacetylase (PgdA/CDA1 family)